nr:non-functional pseudokinase ZED1-like isoform X2 [Coffea arabica]
MLVYCDFPSNCSSHRKQKNPSWNKSSKFYHFLNQEGRKKKTSYHIFSRMEVQHWRRLLLLLADGNLKERPVLVKFYSGLTKNSSWNETAPDRIIRDIVVTSQVSHLKNVLQLVGCCLEFAYPAMVYYYAPGSEFLTNRLRLPNNDGKLLSWKNRLTIATGIANVLLYLHSAFSAPIIFGNLTINKVIIDRSGIAKLFDFGLSISLPPGKSEVENQLKWIHVPSGPQCFKSNIVTLKSDVYSFGVLMLMLFTGETDAIKYDEEMGGRIYIQDYVKRHILNNQFNQIVDQNMFKQQGNYNEPEVQQQLLDFLDLALRCTEHDRVDRPDMIEVAKLLRQMEKSVRCS